MIGKFDIEVYNNRVHYFLTVKRNLTIIAGNSATGKSELIRLISDHNVNGISSGITVKCKAECLVLNNDVHWDNRLLEMKESIVFIDESARFLGSERFAEIVRTSDNYYVIVTRDKLPQLPYSVEEVYGMRTVKDSSKYKLPKRIYNEIYKLYNLTSDQKVIPSVVITEDSNSGFDFFDSVYKGKCVSAGGKSRVYGMIRSIRDDRKLIIVDGAAFGPEMRDVYRYITEIDKQSVVFAPESFEYLILISGIITVPKAVCDETYMYADSKLYMSWEEFYTAYLSRETQNTIYQYSKSKLKEVYRTPSSIKKLLDVLPEQIRP